MSHTTYPLLLEPGTGAAVEVRRGQMLRVDQVDGGQCADLNVFNLADYRETFHSGKTRLLQGFTPTAGARLWSGAPRERPLLTVISDTAQINDVSYPPCSAFIYEYAWGFVEHTNCQDILAEAVREYGLSSEDVHDPFNLWMNTRIITETKRLTTDYNTAAPGDYIEFMAHLDVLAALSVCGGDVYAVSNFAITRLSVSVRDGTAAEQAQWLLPAAPAFCNQRVTENLPIRTERRLSRDHTYVANWPVYPLEEMSVDVNFEAHEYALVEGLVRTGVAGESAEAAVRHGFFSWCLAHEMKRDPYAATDREAE